MYGLLSRFFNHIWYGNAWQCMIFLPASWIFRQLVTLRRFFYRTHILESKEFSIPVIVIGNITVGGTGKTPLVIWMIELLRSAGYRPAIVTRGYRGRASGWPQQVRVDSDPFIVGDEAVLLAQQCKCPIAAGPDRCASIEALLEHTDCNIIVADDGMQHYAMQRDIEVAVIDGVRRLGNHRLLPAGPLREPAARLEEVDFVVSNGVAGRGEYSMLVKALVAKNMQSGQVIGLERFSGKKVHAVCGIGNPARFFNSLRQFGIEVIEHAYPDHHKYDMSDISFTDNLPVLLTEKDAVKCQRFATDNVWSVPVEADLNKHFAPRILALLEKRKRHG